MPFPVFADTLTDGISPPYDSTTKPFSINWDFTLSIRTSGLSILFKTTIVARPAFLICSIASFVWGLTPSSAATTKRAISATLAPRDRMAENASCPGVSIKVIFFPLCSAWYAPICWVMPPDSFSTTFVLRI